MKLDAIRIVLVATSHPGNIGAACRAMKTMGLSRLYLVYPQTECDQRTFEMAAGADDIYQRAVVVASLPAALTGCKLIFATTARQRAIALPGLSPHESAQLVSAQADVDEIAFVFGAERSGLSNDELLHCHYQVHIPSDPVFSSLNLAQSVQIIAYELRMQCLQPAAVVETHAHELATAEAVELFFMHLREVLLAIDFLKPSNPKKLLQRLRRMFNRIHLEAVEVQILRGILSQIQVSISSQHILPTGSIADDLPRIDGGANDLRKKPIYLDYMSTTPVDTRVVAAMLPFLGPEAEFGNPAAKTHLYGLQAAQAIEIARSHVALAIGASAEEVIFTSGATEANNLAIFGAARFYQRKGRHIVTMMTEHKSVLDPFDQLAKEGFAVTYLPPQADGLLALADLQAALRPDTILVSIMHVNNEIGVIQDIAAIADLLCDKGIIFHVDAAQSAGKLAIDLQQLPVSLLSLSAHKNYGPKGVGALFIRQQPRIRLQPCILGGGQERGLRPGTLPTHQIVGMGAAFALSLHESAQEQARLLALRQRLWHILQPIPGIQLNGHPTTRIAHNLNFSVPGIASMDLLLSMPEIAASTASACLAAQSQPSYVLEALGQPRELAFAAIRLSLGRFTTAEDVEVAGTLLKHRIMELL